ncbi:hypothetical protein CRG98_037570 [Punica granatum]|uniref:Uncharacterized protein n=1 Tax=Punica granatum TaxID=22663 RepID=A0A2I0IDQ4_PUNGR|nr:hypothetical protein CRG98_037570 [Punica granatum]
MAGSSSLQPRILSSFVGDGLIRSCRPLYGLFRYDPDFQFLAVGHLTEMKGL